MTQNTKSGVSEGENFSSKYACDFVIWKIM